MVYMCTGELNCNLMWPFQRSIKQTPEEGEGRTREREGPTDAHGPTGI